MPAAEPRMIWFHIGNVRRDTSLDSMREHISGLLEGADFSCELMKTYTSRYNCYKVGISPGFREVFIKSENWGEGVRISRYIFRRSNTGERIT